MDQGKTAAGTTKKNGLLEVNFVDQEMNFRIVKKPLEFIVKSRTTSDEVKK